jgi:ATP-dependent clp protease, ATP-binding subunit clpB
MEENQKISKFYYRLSEDQLDRLRDLLKKVSIEDSSPQSLPRSLRKRRESLFLWELILIGLLCTHAFPIVAFLLVVTLFLGLMDVIKYIISTNLMAWHAVLILWGLPLLVLLICNRLIRVSKKKETDQLMNAANRLLMASENIPQEALSQEMVSLKYFMSVMKWGTDFNQNDIQREDFRISRLKQLLGKINPNRIDIPDSKWGNLQLVQTWIVIADILFCSVLCYLLMFSGYISVTFIITFSLFSILMIGIIIVYKGLLQFQKKKAKQELAELLQLADEEAKRIKKKSLALSAELIQELDDCMYELKESYGMTV